MRSAITYAARNQPVFFLPPIAIDHPHSVRINFVALMNDIVLLSVFSLILLIVFIIIIILANRTRSLTFSERIHPEECQMIHNAPGVSGFLFCSNVNNLKIAASCRLIWFLPGLLVDKSLNSFVNCVQRQFMHWRID